MDAGEFDEALFFRVPFGSGARVLRIGRQALLDLGLPVLTPGDARRTGRHAAEDVAGFLATPLTAEAIASTLEPVEWFTRRYPTALERFASNRRAHARAVARPIIRRPV